MKISAARHSEPSPNFDRLAPLYRWLEYLTFGPYLQRCRIHFLPQITGRRHALVLGDGDGRFTACLFRANRGIRVHAIDASSQMLRELHKRATPFQSQLTIEQADFRTWTPSKATHYDLVVTHFSLDCLSTAEVSALIPRIVHATTPECLWLISEFAIPANLYGKLLAKPLITALYLAFHLLTGIRLQTLPHYAQALQNAGWKLQTEATHLHGLLVSQTWQRQGVHFCIPSLGPTVS